MNWSAREAARIGNQKAIDTADDWALQARARETRRENIRRVALASRPARDPK